MPISSRADCQLWIFVRLNSFVLNVSMSGVPNCYAKAALSRWRLTVKNKSAVFSIKRKPSVYTSGQSTVPGRYMRSPIPMVSQFVWTDLCHQRYCKPWYFLIQTINFCFLWINPTDISFIRIRQIYVRVYTLSDIVTKWERMYGTRIFSSFMLATKLCWYYNVYIWHEADYMILYQHNF